MDELIGRFRQLIAEDRVPLVDVAVPDPALVHPVVQALAAEVAAWRYLTAEDVAAGMPGLTRIDVAAADSPELPKLLRGSRKESRGVLLVGTEGRG